MSKIALSSNNSGTATFTIASPGTNTDRTLILPDATGTVNISGLANEVPSGNAALPAIYPTGDNNTGIFFPAADAIAFAEGGAEVARFDSSGNLLVGKTTSSAGCRFELERTDNDNGLAEFKTNNASGDVLIRSSGGYVRLRATGTNEMAFFSANLERMRIDSSGNLLVGANTALALATFEKTTEASPVIVAKNPQFSLDCWATNTTGNNVFVRFFTETSATQRGSITYNRGGGLVAYNTTSDYRAKDITGEISNASSTVLSLKPYMGTMKGATIERPMFIAHETQEIAPYAVTGEKDAVDNEGNPTYQQMDHSALVPLLTAALQEALAEIANLKIRITALEATQ